MKKRSDERLVRDLCEVIAALDRRVPRNQGEEEQVIARDARAMKRAALVRMAELEQALSKAVVDRIREEAA